MRNGSSGSLRFRQVHRSLTFTTFYCLLEKKPDVLSCNREIRIPFRFVNGITFTVVNGIISLYFCYQSGHLLKGLSFVPHLPYRTPEKIRSPYRCQFKKMINASGPLSPPSEIRFHPWSFSRPKTDYLSWACKSSPPPLKRTRTALVSGHLSLAFSSLFKKKYPSSGRPHLPHQF